MNQLDSAKYVGVPVKEVGSRPVLMDLRSADRIVANHRFFKTLRTGLPRLPEERFDHYFRRLNEWNRTDGGRRETSLKDYERALEGLSVQSAPLSGAFVSERSHQKALSGLTVLPTERFFQIESNLGSGRHALLLDLQLKGCGRNPLASRLEFAHSWGGMKLQDSVYEYVAAQVLDSSLPFGAIKSVATSVYGGPGTRIRGHSRAFAMREADVLRLSQLSREAMNDQELQDARIRLECFLGESDPERILDQLVFQYACFSFFNFQHDSPIPENLTLDSRILDCETAYNAPGLPHFGLHLVVGYPDPGRSLESKAQDSDRLHALLLKRADRLTLVGSESHNTVSKIRYTLRAINLVYSRNFSLEDGLRRFRGFIDQLLVQVGYTGDRRRVIETYFDVTRFSPTQGRPVPVGERDDFSLPSYLRSVGVRLEDCLVGLRHRQRDQLFFRVSVPLSDSAIRRDVLNLYNRRPVLTFARLANVAGTFWLNKSLGQHRFRDALGFSSLLNQLLNQTSHVNPFRLGRGGIVTESLSLDDCVARVHESLPGFVLRKTVELEFTSLRGGQLHRRRYPFLGRRSLDEPSVLSNVVARIGSEEHYLVTKPRLV